MAAFLRVQAQLPTFGAAGEEPAKGPGFLMGPSLTTCPSPFILILRTFLSAHFILGENTSLLLATVS